MTSNNSYFNNLKRRRSEESVRANVIFGQTLGWALTLAGGFHYFIMCREDGFPVLLLGNALLLLGLCLPQSLERPQKVLKLITEFLLLQITKFVLIIIFFLVIVPSGWLMRKLNGRSPFYFWAGECTEEIEGWIPKTPTERDFSSGISSLPLFEIVRHFLRHADLLIMPCLILLLLLGLTGVFMQCTVVAPMIYTLF